jgi:hypothetical protein
MPRRAGDTGAKILANMFRPAPDDYLQVWPNSSRAPGDDPTLIKQVLDNALNLSSLLVPNYQLSDCKFTTTSVTSVTVENTHSDYSCV